MAHPARFLSQYNLTEMGIPFCWTTAISDLLLILKIWFDKLCIAKKNRKLSFVFNELSNSKIILKIEFCSLEKNYISICFIDPPKSEEGQSIY